MPRLFLGVLALALLLPLLLLACGGSDEPTNGTSQGGVAPSIQEQRDRANSDDAESIDEVQFHAMARAAVILNVEPNNLGVGGREFRVKRNPTAPGGAFVYDPRGDNAIPSRCGSCTRLERDVPGAFVAPSGTRAGRSSQLA